MVFNRTQHPHPLPSHTLSVYTVLYFETGQGGGGRESGTREKVRGQQFTKLGQKLQT